MFSLKPKYKMWRVFDQPIGTFVYFFVRCENFALYHNKRLLRADPCCRSVIKEFAHAFSCAYIELWMHLGSLESAQKARVAFFVLSKLPACIHNSIDILTLSMGKFLSFPKLMQHIIISFGGK